MWDQIAGWLVLAGLVAGVLIGRKLSHKKATRLRAEGGRAALAAQMIQTVNIGSGNDERTYVDRMVALGVVTDDSPADVGRLYPGGVVREGARSLERGRHDSGPALAPGPVRGRVARVPRTPITDWEAPEGTADATKLGPLDLSSWPYAAGEDNWPRRDGFDVT